MSTTDLPMSEWFPFPIKAKQKKSMKFKSYEKSEALLDSHFVKFEIFQKNILKRRVNRRLQLDYYRKELIVFTDSNSVFTHCKAVSIEEYKKVESEEPHEIWIFSKDLKDPIQLWAKNREDVRQILEEIKKFIAACKNKKKTSKKK
ncbi:hypothetical protein M0813_01757 [Anaeramoeba flamelloides]|uniref:Uncharacterized protein n=1 Tax=Anaeramoeba flamelloides TaxID=1746091 RepID=A0ABQ8YX24_9EUKA|nr:hypothetical protein M0813_01757 [Anaeramoeba flamelloides]